MAMAKKETSKKVDIFGVAKRVEKTTSKATDKTVVEVDKMEKKLNEYKFLNQQIKALEAKVEAVRNNIIEVSKEKFIELYRDNGRNPKTFILKDGDGCVMVIPYDAYAKIKTQERADEIIEKYGEEAVNINEKYVFNNDVLERNMDAIRKLIGEAKNISTEDKEQLIRVETTYEIKKGFIDNLYRDYEDNMEEVLDDVKPTIALKDCGDRYEEGGVAEDADLIGYVYEDVNYESGGGVDDAIIMIHNGVFYKLGYNEEDNFYIKDFKKDNLMAVKEVGFRTEKEARDYAEQLIDNKTIYANGGGIFSSDGRSTRDKSTWNRGAAWTRDRNEFNKSEDWEVPMRKRKYEAGGGISIERAVESRERDKKRNRLVIKIGDKKWHITQQEAKVLLNQLENLVEKYEAGGGISIERAVESRERDKKRNRLVIKIGDKKWHITQQEAKVLLNQLENLVEKYESGGGVGVQCFCTNYSASRNNIYAKNTEGDGLGWIPNGTKVVRNVENIKKQVNSLADLSFIADIPVYDGVWTYDPINEGAEIHFYQHTGYTKIGNLIFNRYVFIIECDKYDEDGEELDTFGIDWLEDACKKQNVKNGLVDNETNFQLYDYLNKFIEDEKDKIYSSGGGVDGRSTRDKSTWNRGAAWTRDRNEFNKSEDWEVPMRKRKYEAGGGISIERAVESRERDKKRNRLVIKIGDKKWHITQQEAKVLLNQLENLVEKYESGGGVGKILITEYNSQKDYENGNPSKEISFNNEKEARIYAYNRHYKDDVNLILYNLDTKERSYYGIDSGEKYDNYDVELGVSYANGGGVDGRSNRDKSTWNRGAAWTRDRNEFNKNEDWEVPMSKRKHEEGGSMYEAGGNVSSEISREELESKVGRKLNGWGDDTVICEGVTYKKCFLKPYYKKA